jgi:hypothetical protein
MLQRMRKAAPWQLWSWSRATRDAASFIVASSVVLAASCSVYSSDLVDDSAVGVTRSGSAGASAGKSGSALAGSQAAEGGKPQVVPEPGAGEGGAPEGGEPASGGSAGTGPVVTGGSTGTAGNAGTGTGGSAGSGSTGDLLDGFEDNDITLEQTSGRGGVWYLFHDATAGTAGPAPLVCTKLTGAPAALGAYALRITATGFTDYGSGLGVDFRAGKKVYDASAFTGIRYWAKVGAGKNTRHRVQIADATTDKAGAKCNPAPTAPEGAKCDDHFGFNETFTTSWVQYSHKFTDLTQIGWGNSAKTLDKAALYGLQVTAKMNLEVDLWLDQIEFF